MPPLLASISNSVQYFCLRHLKLSVFLLVCPYASGSWIQTLALKIMGHGSTNWATTAGQHFKLSLIFVLEALKTMSFYQFLPVPVAARFKPLNLRSCVDCSTNCANSISKPSLVFVIHALNLRSRVTCPTIWAGITDQNFKVSDIYCHASTSLPQWSTYLYMPWVKRASRQVTTV